MEYHFRAANDADREWSARLLASLDPWRKLGRTYEERLSKCTHPEFVLLMVTDGGAPLGCALCHPRLALGSPYLASLAVTPEAQGRGAGTALLHYVEDHFRDSRFLFLLVSSFNPRARALYEREGYRYVGELPDYSLAGASEHLFMKALTAAAPPVSVLPGTSSR